MKPKNEIGAWRVKDDGPETLDSLLMCLINRLPTSYYGERDMKVFEGNTYLKGTSWKTSRNMHSMPFRLQTVYTVHGLLSPSARLMLLNPFYLIQKSPLILGPSIKNVEILKPSNCTLTAAPSTQSPFSFDHQGHASCRCSDINKKSLDQLRRERKGPIVTIIT